MLDARTRWRGSAAGLALVALLVLPLAAPPALARGGGSGLCREPCAQGTRGERRCCLRACSRAAASCRARIVAAGRACRRACRRTVSGPERHACKEGCADERDARLARCEVVVARAQPGPGPPPPRLNPGLPADLGLLDDAERAVVALADARAVELRSRELVLHLGRSDVEVHLRQIGRDFELGFPIDLGRFSSPEDLEFYRAIARDHFDLAVLENSAKWAKVERAPGERDYTRVDADVEWALAQGFRVKGHTLLWGIVPPFSSSGVPGWLLDRFGRRPTRLTDSEKEELRGLVRRHVHEMVDRYRGRIEIWDATNETLQPVARWFVDALGPEIVADVFRWAHEADPDATLVFNEWIVEVFTGLRAPTAAHVRDRVKELLSAGVPIDVLGQQAHFTPALAFAGVPVDLGRRTRVDDYARALDTLAEAGLPIHVTETNFIAPDEPELRAAQAEALMRLWWGHPAVEQIVFWGPWNAVAGRDEFDVGFWDDAGQPTRHGEAVFSLINDRWRTDATVVSDRRGRARLRAHHGEYVAQWVEGGRDVHAIFHLGAGAGEADVVLLGGVR